MRRRINSLFSGHVGNLFRNAGLLAGADIASSILRLATAALTARALGLDAFGTLILVQTYVSIIDRIVNFQSWQALIKYGAGLSVENQEQRLNDLFKFGATVDAVSALAGAGISAGAALLVGPLLGWDAQTISYAIGFSIVILFNIEGIAIAILRLHRRFGFLALHRFVVSLVKLIVTVVAFLSTDSLLVFLIIAAGCQILGYLLLLSLAAYQFKQVTLSPLRLGRFSRALEANQHIGRFLISTNLHATIRMLPSMLDVIIVSTMLGDAATAVYKVAKELGKLLTRLVQPLYQVIFPDFALLMAQGRRGETRTLAIQAAFIVGIAAIVIWGALLLVGDEIVLRAFGPEYAEAYTVLVWYAFGAALSAAAFPVTPLILALGYANFALATLAASSVIYLVTLPMLLERFGTVGAGMGNVVLYVSWIIATLLLLPILWRRPK